MMLRSQWLRKVSGAATLVVCLTAFQGCTRDPNVKKARYLASGKKYVSQGKEKEAIIQFSNAIKIDSNYAPAHYELAKAYMKLGSFQAAFNELRRTVAADPKDLQARIDMGNMLLAGRRFDLSKQQAEAVLAQNPNDADAYALLSAIAMGQGDRAAALTNIQHALSLDGNKSAYHAALGLIQASEPGASSSAAGQDQLQKAVALDPKNVGAHLVLAQMLEHKGDVNGALAQAQAAVQADPDGIRAWTTEAGIYYRSGNKAQAQATLEQATDHLHNKDAGAGLLAGYLEHENQPQQAISAYAALVSKYPASTPLKLVYARLLVQQGDTAKAQQIASEMQKNNSGDPQVAVLNGMLLLRANKTNDAYTLLQKAAKNSPDNGPVQFWLGEAQLAKGNPTDAAQSFRQALRLNPENNEAQNMLAETSLRNGDYAGLNELADQALAKSPNESAPHVWKGMASLHENHPDIAQQEFEAALKLDPKNQAALVAMGELDYRNKLYPQGSALLQQAVDANPNNISALRLLISYDVFQHDIPKAITLVQQQILRAPQNSSLYDQLAELQLANKEIADSLASSQKAMQLNSADGVAVMNYTRAQIAGGNIPAAVARWQDWKKAHPTDPRADVVLGTLAEAQGNASQAMDEYKKALAIQPDQAVAANNLSYLMLQTGGDPDVALSLAQTARRGMPNSPNTADTLAWAYYQKGIYQSARDLLEDAEHTAPNDASIEYHLGMIYNKLGDKTNAAAHLKKATTLAPNTQTGNEASKALSSLG